MSNKEKAFDIVYTIYFLMVYISLFVTCVLAKEWLCAIISLAATLTHSYMLYKYIIKYNIVR